MNDLINDLISKLEARKEADQNWLEEAAKSAQEFVIVTDLDNGSGLKVLRSISATQHEYNFMGLGCEATGFTKKKALELLLKWDIETLHPKAGVMSKEEFVEKSIANADYMIDTMAKKLA